MSGFLYYNTDLSLIKCMKNLSVLFSFTVMTWSKTFLSWLCGAVLLYFSESVCWEEWLQPWSKGRVGEGVSNSIAPVISHTFRMKQTALLGSLRCQKTLQTLSSPSITIINCIKLAPIYYVGGWKTFGKSTSNPENDLWLHHIERSAAQLCWLSSVRWQTSSHFTWLQTQDTEHFVPQNSMISSMKWKSESHRTGEAGDTYGDCKVQLSCILQVW